MSIIIRLQNLPLSARTGDIRKFFGGLRIPDGGVHILGGDSGDAFIAFMSDEDGRLAMRKDGGRIKDSRIKLFLSSRMEMQHEVEKITKGNFDPSFESATASTDSRSHEKRKRSRSPHQYDNWNLEKRKPSNDHRKSKSPTKYSTKKLSPEKYRSRSPRRRSRSPKLSVKSKSLAPKTKSSSPKNHSFHSLPTDNDFSHFSQKNPGSQLLSPSERQAELERRITEEIEKNDLYKKALIEEENNRFLELQQQQLSLNREPENLMFFSDNSNSNMHHFKDIEFRHDYAAKRERLPFDNNFYIILEGMDPTWGFREVQIILKGHYAPQNNIIMEMDGTGFKTGRAIVKLTNKDDFDNIFKKSFFNFKGKRITVKLCPSYIIENYFPSNSEFRSDNYLPQNHDLCYMLKGLPWTCKYDDVTAFFHGFEVSDVIILYGEDSQATGTGFVSFKYWKDFEEAFSRNGKKIGHRYIEMLPCTAKEMAEAKKSQIGGNFVPYSQVFERRLSTFRRPICAVLTGLPVYISTKKILAFFSESGLKPDAIHITMRRRNVSDGRAFVEFSNYLDFELALKCHGKTLDNHIICVKQTLYDEMVKILDSQKAKHYFATSDPAASTSAEPEKVPYLWEPPDERHEKESYGKNRVNLPSDKFHTHSFAYNKNMSSSFPRNDLSRRNLDPWYPKATEKGNFLHPTYPSGYELDNYDMQARNLGNVMHNPMPYDKGFMPMDDYYSTKKYEENIKSSRLSPENEAALLDFLNRDRKAFSGKSRRSRSIERSKRYPKPRSKDSFRIEKEERYYESSASLHPEQYNIDKNIEKSGCIVQLSNVDISVGTRDLINFLRGFDFAENTLIRRYTEDNMPTPDVRVTFTDKREAERAIRILSKRFLFGKLVDMFIV